jgi:hypothetical protein
LNCADANDAEQDENDPFLTKIENELLLARDMGQDPSGLIHDKLKRCIGSDFQLPLNPSPNMEMTSFFWSDSSLGGEADFSHAKHVSLCERDKIIIITHRDRGDSWGMIAAEVGHPRSTCAAMYLVWTRHGTLTRQRGRPKSITPAISQRIVEETLENRRLPVRALAASLDISRESVRQLRHANGIHFYNAMPVPALTPSRIMLQLMVLGV